MNYFLIALFIVAAAIGVNSAKQGRDCNEKGGVWVRGAFAYECIKVEKVQ